MKILIADDELLVRITVIKALNDLGIQNSDIYQADCGEAMLKLLKSTSIDIAFVDIKMPDISGLEAIAEAIHFSPMTSFYILTGYGTFEYATQAIRLGIKDYLLKPLETQALFNIFQKEQVFIQKKNHNIREYYAAKIKSILLGEQNISNMQDLFCLPCFCICDNGSSPQLDPLYQAENVYSSIKTVIIPKNNCAYLAFCTSSPQYSGTILKDLRTFLEQTLGHQENAALTLCYNNGFVPFSEINHIFQQLADHSVIRITHGIHKLYLYHEKFSATDTHWKQLAILFDQFRENYMQGLYFECSELSRKILNDMVHENIYECQLQINHINQYLSAVFPSAVKPMHTAAAFSNFFEQLLGSLLNQADSEELDIKRVLNYIKKHYTEDISINSLTAEFHISPNYFSSWFKKETNIRFTDYVTNLRITRATQLLIETNLPIKEIASSVGYFTASHFIRTFVKNKGITPAEYRNQMIKERD